MQIAIHKKTGEKEGVIEVNDKTGAVSVIQGTAHLRNLVEKYLSNGFTAQRGYNSSRSVVQCPGDTGLRPSAILFFNASGLCPVFPGTSVEEALAVRVWQPHTAK